MSGTEFRPSEEAMFLLSKKSPNETLASYSKFIRLKIRHNPFEKVIFDGISKLGIRIEPFYLFLEEMTGYENLKSIMKRDLEIEFLGPEDMRAIASIPFRYIEEAKLVHRLKEGKICLGAKYHGNVVAFSWCNLRECHYPGLRFSLWRDEAYSFDAYTLSHFRGMGIASYLRYQLYEKLGQRGRTRLYSITERYNKSAVRFKAKLHAKCIASGLSVELFHRIHFCSTLTKSVDDDSGLAKLLQSRSKAASGT